MKKSYLLPLFLTLILGGCHPSPNSDKCIHYTDSLRVHLEDSSWLRVAIISPEIEVTIRPFAFIYDSHLVVLNKRGSFYTFTANCFERDVNLERMLNAETFKKAFTLNGQLYGIKRDNSAFVYDKASRGWTKPMFPLPFDNRIPAYEDERYICYETCHGEFGGLVFFYNKKSQRVTFYPAVCLSSVIRKGEGYYITSSLSHGYGDSSVKKIENPDSLFVLPDSLYSNGGWKDLREQEIYELIISSPDPIREEFFSNRDDFSGSETLIASSFELNGHFYFMTGISGQRVKSSRYCENHFAKLRYDSTGNPLKVEHKLELPGAPGVHTIIFRSDTLDLIPSPTPVLEDIPFSHGGRSYYTNGMQILNYCRFPDEDEEMDYPERNVLTNTIILRDSSLIRINWEVKYAFDSD